MMNKKIYAGIEPEVSSIILTWFFNNASSSEFITFIDNKENKEIFLANSVISKLSEESSSRLKELKGEDIKTDLYLLVSIEYINSLVRFFSHIPYRRIANTPILNILAKNKNREIVGLNSTFLFTYDPPKEGEELGIASIYEDSKRSVK